MALCSYATVVGYGSLWFSSNKGIRSFGFAAMLGEIADVYRDVFGVYRDPAWL